MTSGVAVDAGIESNSQALFNGLPPLVDTLENLNFKTGVWTKAFKADPRFPDMLWHRIQHILRFPSARRKVRIWTGDKQLSAEALAALAETIQAHPTMSDWLEHAVPGQDACIVLNNLETFDPSLAQAAAHYIQPYLNNVDGAAAITVGTFSGRYAYSPIGIHQDENLYRALHFHYGPGTKNLHAWTADQLPQSALGLSPTKELLKTATSHTVRINDILNIETPVFHVGSAPELCTNLCLLFRKFSGFQQLETIGHELALSRVVNPFSSSSVSKSVPDEWAERSLRDVQTEAERLFKLANKSNGGLAARPLANEAKLTASSILRLQSPSLFPVIQNRSFERDLLIARRQLRYMPPGDGVQNWVRDLVDGQAVKVSEFMGLEDDGQGRLALWEFLRWLSGTGAVNVQS